MKLKFSFKLIFKFKLNMEIKFTFEIKTAHKISFALMGHHRYGTKHAFFACVGNEWVKKAL